MRGVIPTIMMGETIKDELRKQCGDLPDLLHVIHVEPFYLIDGVVVVQIENLTAADFDRIVVATNEYIVQWEDSDA